MQTIKIIDSDVLVEFIKINILGKKNITISKKRIGDGDIYGANRIDNGK